MTHTALAKTVFAAAAIVAASAFALQPGEAEAKVSVNLNFVTPVVPSTAPPPRYRYRAVPNRRYRQPRRHRQYRLSCRRVRHILRNQYGFYDIRPYDCKGKSYWFYAYQNGFLYRVKAASTTGQVIRQIPG